MPNPLPPRSTSRTHSPARGAALTLAAALALAPFAAAPASAVAPAAVGSAFAATATAPRIPQTLTAPDGTAEIWVDVEGEAAATAVTDLSSASAGGPWEDRPAVETPFGASAAFAGAPGAHDLRLRLEPTLAASFTADIAVTYADATGAILSETAVRDARITPGFADADGWIDWAAIVEATEDAGDGGDPGTPDDGSDGADGGSAAGPGSGSDAPPLSVTGGQNAGWLIAAAAGALALGAGVLIAARRNARRSQTVGTPPTGSGSDASSTDADANGADA